MIHWARYEGHVTVYTDGQAAHCIDSIDGATDLIRKAEMWGRAAFPWSITQKQMLRLVADVAEFRADLADKIEG